MLNNDFMTARRNQNQTILYVYVLMPCQDCIDICIQYNRHGQGDVSDSEIKERLKVAEKMLTLREQQVLAREDGLDTVEEGLKLRKDDLRFREEDLNIRQEELDVREQRLLAREQELEKQIRDI
jgi:hypothetical protein